MYEKLIDPITDMTTTIDALFTGAFGSMGGDQREGLKIIYENAGGLYSLLTDIIMSLGLENIARRPALYERFTHVLVPMRQRSRELIDLVDGPLRLEQEVAVQFLHDTALLLQNHMDKLWLYSRLMHDKIAVQHQPIQLDHVLPLVHLDASSEVRLQIPVAVQHPPILGDVDWLVWCLDALIRNAIQASSDNHVTVETQTRGIWLDIRVRDNGNGIAPDEQGRIFEPYYQILDNPERLGLGLTIAQLLTRLQGGTLNCESTPGVVTVFTLSLPLAPVSGARD